MKLWIVSMECAGIAEAGGVKNVTFSLCNEFSKLNHKTTLFIPVFKCNTWENIANLEKDVLSANIDLCGEEQTVTFSKGSYEGSDFNIVFVNHQCFAEKEGVYTYTEHEEELDCCHKKGSGHEDMLFKDILFQKAVVAYGLLQHKGDLPDIIHCQDASTATLPALLAKEKKLSKIKTVVTIHNCGPAYHHNFSSIGEAAWYTDLPVALLRKSLNHHMVEPFLLAAESGAHITTVSEVYAEEITDPENDELTDGLAPIFAERGIKITGITNGFDFDRYNPEDKNISLLPFEFNPEKRDLEGKWKCRKFFIQNIINTDNYNSTGVKKIGKLECSSDFSKEIYIAYHGRFASQKGLNVLATAVPVILDNFSYVRFIFMGQGEVELENTITELTKRYPGKITYLNGYNRSIARMVCAVNDFIVLPSYFEPCGLEDFIAQSYGTLPVAHKTGGLNKIIEEKSGFLYPRNTTDCLVAKLCEVIMLKKLKPAEITKMIKNAATYIHKEYLWKTVVQKKYLPFFKEILKK